jgi:hypothetical protein
LTSWDRSSRTPYGTLRTFTRVNQCDVCSEWVESYELVIDDRPVVQRLSLCRADWKDEMQIRRTSQALAARGHGQNRSWMPVLPWPGKEA